MFFTVPPKFVFQVDCGKNLSRTAGVWLTATCLRFRFFKEQREGAARKSSQMSTFKENFCVASPLALQCGAVRTNTQPSVKYGLKTIEQFVLGNFVHETN